MNRESIPDGTECYLNELEQETLLEWLLQEEQQRKILSFISSRWGSDLYDAREAWNSFFPKIKKNVLRSFRRDKGEFWNYFLRCLGNHCRKEARDALELKLRESPMPVGDGSPALVLTDLRTDANPEEILIIREWLEKGIAELHRSSPELAEALLAVDVKQQDLASAAAAQGIKPGTLRVRLHRARRKLREILDHLQSNTGRH